MRTKILVIDDEESICEILKFNLEKEGYEADGAYSAEEALEMDLVPYQLFIVDIMMDRLSGFDFAKKLKNNPALEYKPIIFCSALNGEDETVMGLNIGADDYITKPFHNEELLARIKVHLKNSNKQTSSILKYKDIELNPNEFTVICNSKNIILTKHEFELLKALIKNPNQALTKSMLFDIVWGDESFADENTLNVHISKIRNKLKEANQEEDYIETIWGIGYRMKK